MEKVILISIDGMRPDGFLQCGNDYINELMKIGSYTLNARTIMPSITLACHMSMFHSVPAERHGVYNNTYVPMANPVNGIFEQVTLAGGHCGMYYGWDPLRDIARPKSVDYRVFINELVEEGTDGYLTDEALKRIKKDHPEFMFLYMVETDQGGHDFGWMSKEYLDFINKAIDNVKRVIEEAGDEYTIIITADHGGHGDDHQTDMDEDMIIPMFFIGKDFEAGKELYNVSILDIAPTVTDIMGIAPAAEWVGKSLK